MGPIWGLVLSIGVFGLYYVTSNPLFAAASSWMALINLVNLIPINPLDGGRILKSLALSVGVNSEIMRKGVAAMLAIGSICIIIACAVMGLWLFVLLGSLGLLEVILEIKKPSTMVPMSSGAVIKYFALSILVGGLLFSIMYYTKHLPGSDIAMQFLKE
mgnify:FL=1